MLGQLRGLGQLKYPDGLVGVDGKLINGDGGVPGGNVGELRELSWSLNRFWLI